MVLDTHFASADPKVIPGSKTGAGVLAHSKVIKITTNMENPIKIRELYIESISSKELY
jgi:hypothetical protein